MIFLRANKPKHKNTVKPTTISEAMQHKYPRSLESGKKKINRVVIATLPEPFEKLSSANMNNSCTYAEHITMINKHLPKEMKDAVLSTFEKTDEELPEKEFSDHYLGICEKALNVLRDNGYAVYIH